MSGVNPTEWTCPLPLRDYPNVVLGHGGGGKLSSELIEHLFLPAFQNDRLAMMADAAVVPALPGRIAMTTDAFVVHPLFFPGGCIGDLAVNGTVNDLSVCGAKPLYLTASFILEEGLSIPTLGGIVHRMATAAKNAGVIIVSGDTKVVQRGHGDGVFITTTGIGTVPDGLSLKPDQAKPGDAVIISGTIGNHGIAILSLREGLSFETLIESDTRPLHDLVAVMLATGASIRVMRDPTRGGVAATLNEIAGKSSVGIEIHDPRLPLDNQVRSACDLLGLDPLLVANEGILIAIVAAEHAEMLLDRMRSHPHGTRATIIGTVTDQHAGLVVSRTSVGGRRVVSLPIGEQLPRIC